MNSTSLIRCAAVAATAAVLVGCTDLQEQLPATTTASTKVHPDGWIVPASAEFHGKAVRSSGWDMTSCQRCHSSQYTGGTSGVTCTTCHSQPTGPEDCKTCHGGLNAAPPKDIDGNTAVTAPGVGAHQFHLVSATTGKLVQCAECHTVPASLDDSGHVDASLPADVRFNGMLARKATTGVTPNPSYNTTAHTCGGTYCHGAFENGNTTNAPVWNASAGTGAACGTCHGTTSGGTTAQKALPKTAATGGNHPNFTNCLWCHNAVVDANTNIIDGSKHVDGQVALFQYSAPSDCARCHGSATNAAPPTDLSGATSTDSAGVGLHQAHLVAGSGARSVACAECHTVPTTLDYSGADGHLDAATSKAELVFGSLSRTATTGVTPNPAYSFTNKTCSGAYCHGSFANGNTTNAPSWTNASTGACRTCHGGNPAFPSSALPKTSADGGSHPAYATCSWCHGPFDGTKHVNGTAELLAFSGAADCSRCHGSGTNAAPPNDLSGNTATTARGVGAHQAHLVATSAKTVKCVECHTVPAALDYTGADGHMEGTSLAEVAMNDTLARTITTVGSTTTQIIPNPTYNPADQSCSNTYCHGTFDYGNPSNAPTWTNAASGNCGTCHGNAGTGSPLPPSPHPQTLPGANNCQNCHTVSGGTAVATYNSGAGTWSITNAARHMNGRRNTFNTEGTY